jgi:hypothetical protein
MRPVHMRLFVAFCKGMWIFGLLFWLYLLADLFTHHFSDELKDVSFYIPIRTDLAAIVAFIVSFIFFVLWSWLKNETK